MLSGNSHEKRKTKRIECSDYWVTDHESFKLVFLNRWVLQTVTLQIYQQYCKNIGTNGPTCNFVVFTLLTCGCVDFIKISSLSYPDTTLHGSQATGKRCWEYLERNVLLRRLLLTSHFTSMLVLYYDNFELYYVIS